MADLRSRLGKLIPECGGGYTFDFLCPLLIKHEAVIAGGLALQSVIGEAWESSDVDVYVTEDKFKDFLADLAPLRSHFRLLPSPNYHNSFMRKNNIAYLAFSQIPIEHVSTMYKVDILAESPVFGATRTIESIIPDKTHAGISSDLLSPELKDLFYTHSGDYYRYKSDLRGNTIRVNGKKLSLQIMAVKSGTSIRSVVGSYDLNFCQVLFDGKNFEVCGDVTMEDIIHKRGKLNEDYYAMFNYTLYKRINKYINRGFDISIDWARLTKTTKTIQESLTDEQNLTAILYKESCQYLTSITFTSFNIPNIPMLFSLLHLQNIMANAFSLKIKLLNYPECESIIPRYISELNPDLSLAHLFAEIFQAIKNIPDEPIYPVEKYTIAETRDRRNKTFRDYALKLFRNGDLYPSEKCYLVGTSALSVFKGIVCKPTYMVYYDGADGVEFSQAIGLSPQNGPRVNYEEFNKFNIIGVRPSHDVLYPKSYDTMKMVLACWPVPCMYFDGTTWMTQHMTDTFSFRMKWARQLRRNRLLMTEFENMIKLGLTFVPENNMIGWGGSIIARWANSVTYSDGFYKLQSLFTDVEFTDTDDLSGEMIERSITSFNLFFTHTITLKSLVDLSFDVFRSYDDLDIEDIHRGTKDIPKMIKSLIDRGYNLDDNVVDVIIKELGIFSKPS